MTTRFNEIEIVGVPKVRNTVHNESGGGSKHRVPSREYKSWGNMIARCYNPRNVSYSAYGAKGITVYEEWRNNFQAFLDYVGRKPSPKHTLDRYPNPKGNYEPGNVRWASPTEQNRNKPNNRLITFEGKTATLSEWAEILKIGLTTLKARLDAGWTVEQAFTKPIRLSKYHKELK